MLALVRITNDQPTGWIIATDVADATRQAYAAWDHAIADALYRLPPEGILPALAKQELLPGVWMLRR